MANALFIPWSEFYSVGCADLDSQHKVILEMVNDLYRDLGSAHEAQFAKVLLDRLVDYTMRHFAAEEAMLAECGYPDLVKHKSAHERLVSQTLALRQQWSAASGRDLLKLLKEWWVNHICGIDKGYTPYLSDKVAAT